MSPLQTLYPFTLVLLNVGTGWVLYNLVGSDFAVICLGAGLLVGLTTLGQTVGKYAAEYLSTQTY